MSVGSGMYLKVATGRLPPPSEMCLEDARPCDGCGDAIEDGETVFGSSGRVWHNRCAAATVSPVEQ